MGRAFHQALKAGGVPTGLVVYPDEGHGIMINGLKVTLVDVSGTYVAEMMPGSAQRHNSPGFRLRAAVIETSNGPYFIKLTGPAKTIDGAGPAFDQFLTSLAFR